MSRQQAPTPSWRSAETRHYCPACNVWMGNDRQSILLHENGKKHIQAMEQSQQDRRDAKVAQDQQAQQLKSSLKAMEQAAMASMTGGDAQYYDTSALGVAVQPSGEMYAPPVHSGRPPPPPPPPPPKQKPKPAAPASTKKEKQAWNARKKQRQDEKAKKRNGNDSNDDDDDDDDDDQEETDTRPTKRRPIRPDEGHYTLPRAALDTAVVKNDDTTTTTSSSTTTTTTYLEGIVFAELLEPEMPLQIWTGSNLSSPEERKLAHHQDLWMDGLVVSIQQRKTDSFEDRMVVKVAYLKSPTDEEETLEEGVRLHRLRIVLGGDPDGNSIPTTLEEARILAMGGEEIDTTTNNNGGLTAAEMDEATGLSGWSTIQIKRTTVHQEAREERARERLKQQQARRKADDAAKEAATRQMEESKVANAEDSALGAFDVWSQTAQGGYKGVDIHTEATVTVADTAKRLAAKGESVAFKKSSKAKFGKLAGKKRNRRTTSADDD